MKKFLLFICIAGIGFYFLSRPEVKPYIDTLFHKNTKPAPDIKNKPGTVDNPFNWSTSAQQITSAPDLPEEGSIIYVLPASGKVRLAISGEISWAKNEYTRQYGAISASVRSNPKPADTVKTTSTVTQRPGITSNQRQESSSQKYTPYIPDPPVIMYYGADIGQFPGKVRNWIVNTAFTKEKMEGGGNTFPQLKAWWSDNGNSVSFEASYIVAPGYIGAGTKKTWGNQAHYRGVDLQRYGQYAKYQTLKFKYELKREVEYLIAHDPAYAEIIDFAKKLCDEIEYDWTRLPAYKGAKPIRTPGKRYAVCEGYGDEVMNKALSLKYVRSVEKWTGPMHTWNVLNLIDGRTLYFDLTWFDNEHIDEKTGKIYQKDDYGWENITFNEELFKYSNVGYSTNVFTHSQGKFHSIVRK